MNNERSSETEYKKIESQVGEKILGIWDVYVNGHNQLFYDPLDYEDFQGVARRREGLLGMGSFRLVAVEIAYREVIEHQPGSRKVGCFRNVDLLSPDFLSKVDSQLIEDVKNSRENESNWMRGGPKPNLGDYVNGSSSC